MIQFILVATIIHPTSDIHSVFKFQASPFFLAICFPFAERKIRITLPEIPVIEDGLASSVLTIKSQIC